MKKLLNTMQLRNTIKNGDRLEIRNNYGQLLLHAGIVTNRWKDGTMKVGGSRRYNLCNFASLTKYHIELVTEFGSSTSETLSRVALVRKEERLTDNISVNEDRMKLLHREFKVLQDTVKSDKEELKIVKKQLTVRLITAGDFIHNLDKTLELIKGKKLTDDLTGNRIQLVQGLNFEKNRILYITPANMSGRTTRIKVG
tara:strand:- start:661 stop:1254 length:594 start_codon:yes stop_codon:yes gene_type:complete